MNRDYLKHIGFTQTAITMSNTQLPAEWQQRIDEETQSYAEYSSHLSPHIAYRAGATTYALKLLEAQQEIERLKQWKEEAKQLLNPIWDYAEDNLKVALGESKVSAILERSKRAQYLLKQVIASDAKLGVISTGITNEIKTFLDGK